MKIRPGSTKTRREAAPEGCERLTGERSGAGEPDLATSQEGSRAQIGHSRGVEMRISNVAREWRATFDAIPDLISVHDFEHRIVRANRALADHLGMHPRDLIGKRCFEVMHGSEGPWPSCPHQQALAKNAICQTEVDDPHLRVPLLITCTPMLDDRGRLVGTVHVARDISAKRKIEEEREKLIAQLQTSLAQVKLLSGLLPICSSCKKIRDDQGYWTKLETYLCSHSEAEFTHGICPECTDRLYPGYGRKGRTGRKM